MDRASLPVVGPVNVTIPVGRASSVLSAAETTVAWS